MKTHYVLSVIALTSALAGAASAQNQGLPQGWDTLSAADFVKSVEKQKRTQGPLVPEQRQAVAKQAVELMLATDQALDQISYSDMGNLLRYGKSQLTADQTNRIRQRIVGRADGKMKFLAMRGKVAAMTLTGVPEEQKEALVSSWVSEGNLEAERPDLSPLNALWLYDILSHPFLQDGGFSVVWSGNLRAPTTGTYVFSLPPMNVNTKWKDLFIKVDWKITVGGVEVLRATPEQWKSESTTVELTADKPIAFRAEAHFNVARPMQNEIHAILYWRGPGVATSLVPAESWTTPDGSGPGLAAEYHATVEGNKVPQTISRVDRTIDFNWARDRVLAPKYAKEQQRAIKYFWDQFMSPEYLDRCAKGKAEHPFLMHPIAFSECLDSSQRRSFLNEVLQRKAMLAPLDAKTGTYLYPAYRLGAEKDAIEAVGSWCVLHSDLAPDLPRLGTERNLFAINRIEFVHLAHRLKQEYPALLRVLEDKYLQTPDGRCSLPTAYTLAYAYRVQKKIDVWIRLVTLKLAEPSVTGGQRINWLIARAMAEEIRRSSADEHSVGMEDLSAGIKWLKEAQDLASTDDQRLQVAKEFVARDVALSRFDVAKLRLDTAGNAMQKGPPKDAIRLLGVQADRIAAKIQRQNDDASGEALAAYRKEIARRQEVATDKGDAAEADRLGQLLDAAK